LMKVYNVITNFVNDFFLYRPIERSGHCPGGGLAPAIRTRTI
jgi:hypothetical protein